MPLLDALLARFRSPHDINLPNEGGMDPRLLEWQAQQDAIKGTKVPVDKLRQGYDQINALAAQPDQTGAPVMAVPLKNQSTFDWKELLGYKR